MLISLHRLSTLGATHVPFWGIKVPLPFIFINYISKTKYQIIIIFSFLLKLKIVKTYFSILQDTVHHIIVVVKYLPS